MQEWTVQGSFKHLFDFCARVDRRKDNQRVPEALINNGAMGATGPSRPVSLPR